MAYAVPLILSLKAEPAFAANGSAKGGDERRHGDEDGDEDGNEDGDSQGRDD